MSETVEIIRDRWGIPHVFAESSEGAFFGLGYASAEDRMFQMECSRREVQGRLAEIIDERVVESDKQWRILGWYRMAKEIAKNLDPETKKLLQAYSAGVNKYLQDYKNSLIYLFDKYGIRPEPWTVADSISLRKPFRLFQHLNEKVLNLHRFEELVQKVGWDQAVMQMSQPPIIDESSATLQKKDMDPQLIAEIKQYAKEHGYYLSKKKVYTSGNSVPKGSHAWVVGGKRSITGSAILHSDPQIEPITAPGVSYEAHICGGDFDARGRVSVGSPEILIGWNRNIAWGATALGADLYDLFKLDINPSDPNQYYYDGAYRDMETHQETILVRGGENVTVTYRKTVWGPVVTPLIPEAKAGEEFALKLVEFYDLKICSLQALIKIMKAHDWESFEAAIENYLSPGMHMIYGDKNGNIGYQMLAAIPLRSKKAPLAGIMTQPGDSSVYDWQGFIPKKYLPHAFNPSSGMIATANNLPVGRWYPLSLLFPYYYVRGGGARAWRLLERLAMLPKLASQDDVLAIHRDMVNPVVREMVRLARFIVDTLGQRLSNEAMNALEVLSAWNGEYNTSEKAYPLIVNFDLDLRASGTSLASTYESECHFAKIVKEKLDQDPGYVPTDDEKNYVDFFLRSAWIKTVGEYGDDPSEWLQRYDKAILIVYQNNLDPDKDFRSPNLKCKYTSTIWSQHGNMYSQDVRFDDIDASKSVCPPGISEDPKSPFFKDQIPIWAAGELHEAPLNREKIENMMTSRKQLKYHLRQQ